MYLAEMECSIKTVAIAIKIHDEEDRKAARGLLGEVEDLYFEHRGKEVFILEKAGTELTNFIRERCVEMNLELLEKVTVEMTAYDDRQEWYK